jgi:hypothetical protein
MGPLLMEGWLALALSRNFPCFAAHLCVVQLALIRIDCISLNNRSRSWSERIDLGRHNEIIPVETADCMRPKSYCHLPPFGENCWVMTLSFGKRTHAVRERQGIGEVPEGESTLEPLNTFALDNGPVRHFRLQVLKLRLSYPLGIASACDALFNPEVAHRFS